jgi:hypothetical protein
VLNLLVWLAAGVCTGRLTVCQGGLHCRSCDSLIKVISHYQVVGVTDTTAAGRHPDERTE